MLAGIVVKTGIPVAYQNLFRFRFLDLYAQVDDPMDRWERLKCERAECKWSLNAFAVCSLCLWCAFAVLLRRQREFSCSFSVLKQIDDNCSRSAQRAQSIDRRTLLNLKMFAIQRWFARRVFAMCTLCGPCGGLCGSLWGGLCGCVANCVLHCVVGEVDCV